MGRMGMMGRSGRRSSAADDGEQLYPPNGSRLPSSRHPRMSNRPIVYYLCFAVFLVPEECMAIARRRSFLGGDAENHSFGLADLGSSADAARKSHKDAQNPTSEAQYKPFNEPKAYEGFEQGHEGANESKQKHSKTKLGEHQHPAIEATAAGQRVGGDIANNNTKTTDSPNDPQHLGQKEFLEQPFANGMEAILNQSTAMVQSVKEGIVESRALKQASKLASDVRGEIVKDVEALSATLSQEHANLAILRKYEREQDALLKAQLGYLMPISSTSRAQVPALAESSANFTTISVGAILACSALTFVFGCFV